EPRVGSELAEFGVNAGGSQEPLEFGGPPDWPRRPPASPRGGAATPGDAQVTVSWDNVAGATSYNLYYRAASSVSKVNGIQIAGAISPQVVAPLITDTLYAFGVTAVGPTGESPIGSVVTATPVEPPPPPPTTTLVGPSVLSAGVTGSGLQSSEVELGEVVAEYGVDLNGNGQYDQLVLEVEVTATRAGEYWFLGDLSLDASQPQSSSQSSFMLGTGGVIANALTATNLAEGTQRVKLIFGGPSISLKRANGPYVLSGVWVTDVKEPGPEDFMNNSLGYRGDVYTTAAYQATDFETYGAMLTGSYSYRDVDSDGDGRSDGLEVKTGIRVYEPGSYRVEGSLYDSQGAFIGHATWTGVGPEVTLQFGDIAGTFGPYDLRDLDLLNAEGQSIDYVAEATVIESLPALASPDVASFEVLPAGSELMAQGETITPTQVFTGSLVGGNLRVQAEVQVSEVGSYKMEAWLADTDGNLVTWAVGAPTSLSPGKGVLSVTFAGGAIRARGVEGPYQVVALKVLDGGADYAVLDKVDVALTTQAYTLDQFAASDVAIFEDFMEDGSSQWDGDSSWGISQGASYSPSHAWHGTDADASLALASLIDLSGLGRTGMRFQTSYKLGSAGDTGYVEGSTDGVHWDTLATFSGDASWSTRILDLSQYDGESAVYLRFRLASAGGASDDGWYVDDVLVARSSGGDIFLPIILK
ncbi:MAG: hypothetical protein P8X95_25400, partial [Anaerolineales bacterium]